MTKDAFEQVPEFLAAFGNIAKNGFFGNVALNVLGHEGTVFSCTITATGYVPSDKKYMAKGSGAVVDPDAIVASCRTLAAEREAKSVSTKIETGAWPLWDAEGGNIVGSKGTCTKIMFEIAFETRE